ncbi:MAG: hypothetical protein CMJ84_00440 [Planctomycetes bacterium]|nr:hypothetical protein [Planctomycetota bacterium]MDP6410634.1 oligosaccharide flippase family protein [Planctomycetota bacterium]
MGGDRATERDVGRGSQRPTAELARAVFSFGTARVASQFGMFVIMVALARTCGPEAFGAVSFALAMVAILYTPADFGTSAGIQRFVGELGESILRPAFAVKLIASCLTAVAVWLLDRHLGLFHGLGGWIAVIVATSAFPFVIMAENARKRFRIAGALQVAMTIVFGIGALAGSVEWDPVNGPLAARAVSFTLMGLALAPILRAGAARWKSSLRALWEMGSAVMANGVFTQVVTRADVVLIAYMAGFEATGVYRAALTLGSIPLLLQPLFHVPFMPVIATQLQAGRKDVVRRLHRLSTAALAMAVLPILMGGWVFAGPLLARFYGNDYAGAIWVLRLLLVGSSAQVLLAPMGGILYMAGQVKVVASATALAAAVLLVASFAAIPTSGGTGAAAAACAAQVSWLVFVTILYHRRHPLRLAEWRVGPLGAVAAVTLAVAIAARPLADDWPGLLGALALTSAVYVAALGAIGLLAPGRVLSLLRSESAQPPRATD